MISEFRKCTHACKLLRTRKRIKRRGKRIRRESGVERRGRRK